MKRIYTLALLLLFACNCKAQFFQEDFANVFIDYYSTGPTKQWTADTDAPSCGDYFMATTDGSWLCGVDPNITTDTLVYAGLANKSMKGMNGCDDFWSWIWFTSPWINCSGQSQVYLTFANMRANCYQDFFLTIYDSAATYTIPILNSTTPNVATFDTVDISAYAANKSKVAFDFTMHLQTGGTGSDFEVATWIVDDVSLYNPSCNINNQVGVNGIYSSSNQKYTSCINDSIKLFLIQPQTTQTFQWYLNGNAIVGAIDSIYYASDSGFYSCKITDTCGYVFTKDIDVMQVSPLTIPPSISCTGDLVYCPPSIYKAIFTGLLTDPYTYQWYNNGVLIPNQTNYTLICNQLTPYYAIVTNACGSYSTDTVTIAQGTTPIATVTPANPFPTCYPTPFTLTAFDSAGYSFQWKKNNVNIPGQTNNSFTTASSQSFFYTCMVTDATGCTKTSVNLSAGGYSGYTATIAAMGPISFCIGDSVVLAANQGTGFTYQWLHNNVLIPLATQNNFTASQAGSFNAYVNNNVCTMLSNNINIYVPCIGSGSIPPAEARYADDAVETTLITTLVDHSFSISSADNILSVIIYSSLGKIITAEKLNSISYNFNTSALKQGMYFITVQTNTRVTKSKFVVEHFKR